MVRQGGHTDGGKNEPTRGRNGDSRGDHVENHGGNCATGADHTIDPPVDTSDDQRSGGGSNDDGGDTASNALVHRRTVLQSIGLGAILGTVGVTNATGTARASREVSSGDGYEVWTIEGKEIYDLSDGEELSNVLVDQSADGACLTIRARNKSGWAVRNVGFLGVGQAGDGGNRFQFQVSAPSGGAGEIENVWANGKARDGQPASELGGIYVRSSHGGHIDVRNTYIEGFGNNAVYASAVGKDGGNDGSVTIENAYHRDNTASQFRIGSPDSVVRNSVGVIDDPEGERGPYPGSTSNRNARGVWGKHFRNQRFENCAFYVSPDDAQPDGVFEARYIGGRSHGEEAVVEAVGCHVNPDAPALTGATSNAEVTTTGLGLSPAVDVIGGGGVPLSAEMAARGERKTPPEIPAVESGARTTGTTRGNG